MMSDDEKRKRTELFYLASRLYGEVAFETMAARAEQTDVDELNELFALSQDETGEEVITSAKI